jgi:hypothetical protein
VIAVLAGGGGGSWPSAPDAPHIPKRMANEAVRVNTGLESGAILRPPSMPHFQMRRTPRHRVRKMSTAARMR